MKKIKVFGIILVLVGGIFGGHAVWKLYETKEQTDQSLEKAKALVSQNNVQKQNEDTNDELKDQNKETKNEKTKVETSADENEKRKDNSKTKDLYKPQTGDVAGLLTIPAINAELPIVEGTDPNDLAKGVGHYKGSFYPEQNGQIVLSGHRDTVFRRAGELRKGDTLRVDTGYGGYDYIIKSMKIVSKDDNSIITLQHEKEELILTTCYPFSYIGDAPDRYIIYAYPK
ncbi:MULTISPECIES: class D sortase [Bacillus amyloliquefaciens group]|uniref:class D sortase n=1 Tax=Bacillus amyloliquefaciens group TaxID=1938374 RepID=UPI002AF7D410|nr:class D sortase [Streptococcus agalactiae]